MNFSGKVVLIASCSPELGIELARQFLQAKAFVLTTGSVSHEEAKRVARCDRQVATGIEALTVGSAPTLASFVEATFGKLDTIVLNNYEGPTLDFSSVTDTYSMSILDTLSFLHPLLADGGTIVLCSPFAPEAQPNYELQFELATAVLGAVAEHWAKVLSPRSIRVNVVTHRHVGDSRLHQESGAFDLSHSSSNSESQKSERLPSKAIEQSAASVLFMASDVSRPWSGMQLFSDGELRAVRSVESRFPSEMPG
ncbi:SDR family NAD(P)-dependent oxidoreductase [Granulicella paludicola]|uniref:SDR family NAD(P)-dependent oxidoreductase n=1 Tax=Granulicella paludicola TaxID=474951 RepID=UPI0021E0A055|nr:SDR family oxidoreductase [Granulicella paludicola]